MTDFYALLKQSIIERDIRDPQDREAVYAQARQAIVKQLWAFRPPLAADEIDTRVGAYDQAVERIEEDLRGEFARAPASPARERAHSAAAQPEFDPPLPDPEAINELEAVREDDEGDDEEVSAPPLAQWRHDDDEDAASPFEGEAAYEDNEEPEPPRHFADERPRSGGSDLPFHDGVDEDRPRAKEHPRWRDDGQITARTNWFTSFGERETVQILAGAIAALIIALLGLALFFFLSRGSSDAVTLDIGTRGEVSDAATASRLAADQMEVVASYSVFDGRDPTIFVTTPDNPVRFASEGGFAQVSSSASAAGVRVRIGPGLAARLAGQPLRVTLVARSSPESGAESMRFAYQSGVAISHWQTANLTPQYEAVATLWRPPAMRTDPAGDFLVIEPGIPGDGTSVDIQSIKIETLKGGT